MSHWISVVTLDVSALAGVAEGHNFSTPGRFGAQRALQVLPMVARANVLHSPGRGRVRR